MAFQEIMFVDADEFIADGNDLSGRGNGLTYFIDAQDEAGWAGMYARQVDAQARDMEALLRSADPNARDVCARLRN